MKFQTYFSQEWKIILSLFWMCSSKDLKSIGELSGTLAMYWVILVQSGCETKVSFFYGFIWLPERGLSFVEWYCSSLALFWGVQVGHFTFTFRFTGNTCSTSTCFSQILLLKVNMFHKTVACSLWVISLNVNMFLKLLLAPFGCSPFSANIQGSLHHPSSHRIKLLGYLS